VLTMKEWHQFKTMSGRSQSCFLFFRPQDPTGRAFAQLAEQSHGNELSARCGLLKFWADIVVNLLPSPDKSLTARHKLRKRFRQLFAQAPAKELSDHSLADLAQQLNCSLRHFRSLFRKEFGMPFHVHQTELRLWHARQLLVESDHPITIVANQCGYQRLSLFSHVFKKRFGMTPGGMAPPGAKEGLASGLAEQAAIRKKHGLGRGRAIRSVIGCSRPTSRNRNAAWFVKTSVSYPLEKVGSR